MLIRVAVFEKKYTEDHEWVEISSDGKTGTYIHLLLFNATITNHGIIATLGISKYAANALGDVVYVEIPETGLELEAGDSLGAIESVKSASDILTPFGGTVLEANEALADKPGTVNNDPEGEGWIAKLEIKGEPEGKLMNAEEYLAFTEEATEA